MREAKGGKRYRHLSTASASVARMVGRDTRSCMFTVMDQLLARPEPFALFLAEECRVAVRRCAVERDAAWGRANSFRCCKGCQSTAAGSPLGSGRCGARPAQRAGAGESQE